jgi:hypothetical protein
MKGHWLGNPNRRAPSDGGFSMIATALSMGATAILIVLLFTTMFKSSASSSTSISNAPGVALAMSLQAQQNLATGLTSVETAAASAGGYGSIDAASLTASDPAISFVTGASSNADTISVAVGGGDGGGTGAATGGIGAAIGAATATATATGAGQGGEVTLADRSSNGTCWLVWKSGAGPAWYGAQTNLPSCTAPALTSTPTASPVSSSSIGWQEGSFPTG